MKILLCIVVLLSVLRLNSQENPPKDAPPVLSNFRIENTRASRVYFDSSKELEGSSKNGFIISGKTISKVSVNSGQTSGHYFTVSRDFTFWNNHTIRYEGGSDIVDGQGNTLNNFTLQYIVNNIDEPEATKNIYYVSVNGNDNSKGTSESTAWRSISKAASSAKSGSTVWIKAGDYGNEKVVVEHSGKVNKPIKFIGYKNSPGDNPSLKRKIDLNFLATEMPLLIGVGSGNGMQATSKDYIIVKNIQVENYNKNIVFNNLSYVYFDNVYVKDADIGMQITHSPSVGVRIKNSYVADIKSMGIWMYGSYHLIENTWSVSSRNVHMDYHIAFNAESGINGYNIIRNSYIHSYYDDSHGDHAISIKGEKNRLSEYTLIENCTIENSGQGIELRHENSKRNVIRGCRGSRTAAKKNAVRNDASLVTFRDGCTDNIVENCFMENMSSGIYFNDNAAEEGSQAGGHNNKVINSIFKNNDSDIAIGNGVGGTALEPTNNEFINCTFYGSTKLISNGKVSFGKSNEIINCIISETSSYDTSPTFSYSNFHNGFSTPSGTANISKDPKFENASNGNFKLKKDSPLIDAGKYLPNVNQDFNGDYRAQGKSHDIGAFEYNDDSAITIRANAGEDQTICLGERITLTATGGSTYEWSTGETTASIEVSPTSSETFKVRAINGSITDEDEVIITVNSVTADAGEDVTIDEGESTTLTASGGETYLWSTGETTESITVSPDKTEIYEVTATKDGCEDTDSVEVVVDIPLPSVIANAGEDQTICLGESITLTATGGVTYEWSTGETTARIEVSPTSTEIFKVRAIDGSIIDEDEVIITVNSIVADAGEDVTIDEGESITLTASGGETYLWSTGETTASIEVSPNATEAYQVTVTENGCEDTDSVEVKVEAITATVIANAGEDQTICLGESITLTASGGSAYEWSTGETTASIEVSPTSTETFKVRAIVGSITDEDEVIITVNSVTADAGEDVTIDKGERITLTASGGDTYLWSTGATTESITVSTNATETYQVTVTENGCEDVDSVEVVVDTPIPTVIANAGEDQMICLGERITLTATGGSTYEWSTGETTSSIEVSPTSTETFKVRAIVGSIIHEDEVIITVNSVTADAGEDVAIDKGERITLTASGGEAYLWNTGETTESITVSPNKTEIYEVTATNNGCEDTDDLTVTVNPTTGSVTANAGADVSICSGESTTLTASGGSGYVWSTGATTSSIQVSPTSTQIYTVTAKDGSGNTDTDDVIITVNDVIANAGSDKTTTEGDSVTLNASGGDSYVWSTGATSSSITVSPAATRIYVVTVTKNGCDDTDSVEVVVEPPSPTVIANAGEDQTICLGERVILTASGGVTYEWSNGETTASIQVSPTSTETFTVKAIDGSVTDEDQVQVNVTSITVDAGKNQKINEGESIMITAKGGETYLWSTGETTESITVSPNKTEIYEVTATKNGCEDTDSVIVSVNTITSTITADAGEDVTIYNGETVVLTASEGTTYEWSTGETMRSITVSPNSTQTYWVEITDEISSDIDEVVVTVIDVIADAGKDVEIYEGDNTTLTANGGDSYLWSTGETTKNIIVSPEKTQIYSVKVYKNEIEDADSVQVTVNPKVNPPEAFAGNDVTICIGESVTLSASGGKNFIWNTNELNKNINVSPIKTTTYTVKVSRDGFTDTDTIVVTVDNCSNKFDDSGLTNNVTVYPNPSTGVLNINLKYIQEDFNIILINLNGIVVYSDKMSSKSGTTNKQIDLSNIVKGYYFVRLFNNNEILIKKILLI